MSGLRRHHEQRAAGEQLPAAPGQRPGDHRLETRRASVAVGERREQGRCKSWGLGWDLQSDGGLQAADQAQPELAPLLLLSGNDVARTIHSPACADTMSIELKGNKFRLRLVSGLETTDWKLDEFQ